MFEFIIDLYRPFFDGHEWIAVLTSADSWLIILSLVLMECLLSVDNAVVLAAQTKKLPTPLLQKKALVYGLWGAYIFRFIAIGLGVYLIKLWEVKVLGALYLAWLAIHHFYEKKYPKPEKTYNAHKFRLLSPFWSVVVSIELMDIAFSVDSVLAALAVSRNDIIVMIGGIIGILCMRGIAQAIVSLMEKIPELESMAYVLIFVIAVKLFLSIPAIDIELPSWLFALLLFGLIGLTVIFHFIKKKKKA